MTVRLSTAMRDAVLEVLNTNLSGGVLRIYSGSQPGAVSTSATGTLLAELTLGTPFGVVTAGVLSASPIIADTAANAAGIPGWARLLSAGGVTARMDLSVTGSAGAGELKLDNMDVKVGALVGVTSLTITAPAP